eukprot:GHVH01004215.1.p1 GENE.GHVH01004215.1~~GHVH01004215.1.p1  ORF type:complete len:275 (-),score=47.88 GHVH01004215.1:850-1674(-)
MSSTNPTKISTEWDDLQVKHGNFAPAAETVTEATLTSMVTDFAEQRDYLDDLSLKDLDKLEDDVEEDTLEVYRQKRLEELRAKKAAYKFGKVYEISKPEYTHSVTEGSADNWVVCVLYSPKHKQSEMLIKCIPQVATKFGDVKFVQGEVSSILEGFPASNTPTVLLYYKKKCFKQLMGLEAWGGEKVSEESVEWRLSRLGIVTTDLTMDPTKDEFGYNKLGKTTQYNHKELYGANAITVFSDEESVGKSESSGGDRDDRGYMSNQIKGRRERYH